MAEETAPGRGGRAHMPSDVTPRVGMFDRFATHAASFASKPWFFALCVLLVLLWAPSYFVIGNLDTWQLIINTATTIVTFLMVALLQNTESRSDRAVQDKLNAIAEALANLMASLTATAPQLQHDLEELRDAVGLEDRESA
ncbi:low affinity iron permease family protein [Longispora sp. K20-0274]|uniref:low affinity iron permease family protein n=1 Tax=Longispora sp. K20-0274 TaxID=3088255 RepID=UPI00399B36A7